MSAICDANKKKVELEQLYNSVHRRFNELEIRYGRENQQLGPRLSSHGERKRNGVMAIRVGVNMLQFWVVVFFIFLSSHGERKRNGVMAIRVGVNMLQFWVVVVFFFGKI